MLPRRARQSFNSAVSEPPAQLRSAPTLGIILPASRCQDSKTMSATDPRPRPDLAALRINRDAEEEHRTLPIGRIAGWIVALIVVAVIAWAGYTQFIVPRRAPVVETIVVKPTVNLTNSPLLAATGYLVANKP